MRRSCLRFMCRHRRPNRDNHHPHGHCWVTVLSELADVSIRSVGAERVPFDVRCPNHWQPICRVYVTEG